MYCHIYTDILYSSLSGWGEKEQNSPLWLQKWPDCFSNVNISVLELTEMWIVTESGTNWLMIKNGSISTVFSSFYNNSGSGKSKTITCTEKSSWIMLVSQINEVNPLTQTLLLRMQTLDESGLKGLTIKLWNKCLYHALKWKLRAGCLKSHVSVQNT